MTFSNYALSIWRHGSRRQDWLATKDWDDRTGVVLTSYRFENRLERLRAVCEAIRWLAPDTAEKIGRLHDHKGFLTVFWLVQPNYRDRLLCETVWASSIARELGEHVEHLLFIAHEI